MDEPYTRTLLVFTALSALAIRLFYYAGRRFFADREHLYSEAGVWGQGQGGE